MKKQEIRNTLRALSIKSLEEFYNNENQNYECRVVIISGNCCPYCDAFNNQYFTFEEIFNDMRIHTDKCTNEEYCKCFYSFDIIRDQNEMLIRKKK